MIQDFLANRLGDFVRKTSKKRRIIARTNLDLCFPNMSDCEKQQILCANFRHMARSLLHYGLFWWAPNAWLNRRISIVGEENILDARIKGRSVIVMAAHSLGLESAAVATTLRYQATGIFNPMKNKLLDWLVARGRTRHGGLIHTRRSGLRPLIKDVRQGAILFYLPDEDLGKDRSLFSAFFGVQKATVPVLGRLSKSCNADVIPCIACYDEASRQYIIHYFPALTGFPTGDDAADTLLMNQALEKIIDLCPEQYFWTMKLFKTRPKGEAGYYN